MFVAETESRNGELIADFRSLLEKYQDRVYNQAFRMLGSHEDAQEAAQDIFLKIHRSLERFRGDSKLSTWVYRVTANECISRLRKKQIETRSIDQPLDEEGATLANLIPDSGPNPHECLESAEIAELVREQVRRLSPDWAMAISLYHFEGLSYGEIADIMNIPKATVGIYIMRGRGKLAKWLAYLL